MQQAIYFSRLRLMITLSCGLAAFLVCSPALANYSLGTVATNMTGAVSGLNQFMMSLSYVIGFAFCVGAILKYKAHRDNPNQVTIGTPLLLLFVGLCLIAFPLCFHLYGQSVFDPNAIPAGAKGVTSV